MTVFVALTFFFKMVSNMPYCIDLKRINFVLCVMLINCVISHFHHNIRSLNKRLSIQSVSAVCGKEGFFL